MRGKSLIATAALALVALTLLVALPAAGLGVADLSSDEHEQANDSANDTASDAADENATSPGEQLSGIVGVGEAELEGDLDKRTFGIKVAQAASQDAQADVVSAQLGDIEQRLGDLEDRKEALDNERDAGEITEGKYKAEMAKLSAQSKSLGDLVNDSQHVAGQFPAELLEEKGINVNAIQSLKDSAAAMSGGAVADAARSIAGPNVGDVPESTPPIEVPADVPAETPGDGDDDDDDDEEAPGDGEESPGNDGENTGY